MKTNRDMSTKYNYLQKKAISRKIADITYIDRYRELLRAVKSPAAGRKMLDRQQLAVSLVYELLAYYTEAQIEELSVQYAPGALANAPSSRPSAVKKKLRNSSSIRISAGSIWTTISSGLRTVYSRTA